MPRSILEGEADRLNSLGEGERLIGEDDLLGVPIGDVSSASTGMDEVFRYNYSQRLVNYFLQHLITFHQLLLIMLAYFLYGGPNQHPDRNQAREYNS